MNAPPGQPIYSPQKGFQLSVMDYIILTILGLFGMMVVLTGKSPMETLKIIYKNITTSLYPNPFASEPPVDNYYRPF